MGNLGDEFQFSFVLPTKSLQRVVTSINGKMTQLILCTKQNTNFISNNDDNLKSLTVASKDIVKVLKSLSESVKESIQTKYKNDVAAVEEIEEATQNLIISAENLHLSSQMLLSMSRSLRDVVEGHQSCDLVSSISKVFQNLTILLICMDNAETRSIIKLCRRTHQCVANMITTKSLKSFTQKFDLFGEVAEEFYETVNRRCADLLDSGTRGKMENYLSQFKHTISMLVTSFSIAIKYPHNREAQSGVDFAYNQMSKAIQGLMNIIESRQLSDDLSASEIGVYPQLTSSIERILSVGRRTDIDDLEVLTKIQSLVQHYIALITLVKKNNLPVHGMAQHMIEDVKKLTERGDRLSALVMQHKTANNTSQRQRKHHHHNSDDDDDEARLGETCRNIRAQLKQLARNAKHLVTSLFAQTFVVTTEPLQALLNPDDDDVTTPRSVEVFTHHTDDVLVACKMVANCCESQDSFQELDCCVKHLKAVTSQLLLMTYEDDGEGWVDAFHDLFVLCASCLDLRTLVSLILKELIKDFETVHVDIVNLSEYSLSKNVIRATGRSKLLTEIGKAEMTRSPDLNVRNAILPLIKQTEQATLLTVANSNHLLEDIAQMSAQEDFISATLTLKDSAKRFCRSLLNCTTNNQQATNEQPTTTGIRDFNDTALVVGLVHEMSNLQNKLSTVGISEAAASQLDFNSPPPPPPQDVADKIDMLLGTSGEHVMMESDDEMSSVVENSQFVSQVLDAFNKGRNEQIDSITNNMVAVTDLVREVDADITELLSKNYHFTSSFHDMRRLSKQLTESVQMLKVALDLPPPDTPTGGYNISEEVGKHAAEWEGICGKVVKRILTSSWCQVRDDDVLNMRVMTSLVDDVMTLVKRRCQYSTGDQMWSDDDDDSYGAVDEESFINLVERFTQIHKKMEKLETSKKFGVVKSAEVAVLGYLHLTKFNRIKLAIDDVIERILKTRAVKLPSQEVLLSTDSGGNQLFMYNLRLATISQWLADVIRTVMMGVGGTKIDLCISKIKKAHIRCDVTKKGIEETIKLILRLDDEEKMGLLNSRVCSRFEYLHRRFMLEISRLYLFAKSLSTLKTDSGNTTTEQQLERSGNYELNSTALFDSTKDFIKPSATMTSPEPHKHHDEEQMEDELEYLLTCADVLNEGSHS